MATPKFDPDRSLEEQVLASIEANTAVNPVVDAPLIGGAITIARQIDRVLELAELGAIDPAQVTKVLYLLPHLSNHLKEMLATPTARLAADKLRGDKPSGGSKLDQMRRDAQRGPRPVPDADVA